ncbi:MAG TPA: HAMP domain-containing sensor histidine kinase [Caulobacteraceae bacterium]|nr:HAMP domain-containing sensor histidine kinase [Caulobacteraceae bacterium]
MFWPGGLSARLLIVTVLMIVFANVLILPPSLAAFQENWLLDRLQKAELASRIADAAPAGVTERTSQELLRQAEVVLVAIQADGVRRLVLQAPRLARTPYLIDLRQENPVSQILGPIQTLTSGDRMLRVVARPRFIRGESVEIVTSDAPLKQELLTQLGRLLAIAAFTSVMAGAVVFFSLNALLVRPMQRITRAMEKFRANPEDPEAHLTPSGRRDEIGRAEVELDRMQADLRAALSSRARLAALGEAVAKINHDLRNMLASAQIASERMAQSGDPKVAQALPRLERALDRATRLATNVLTFGKSDEPAPDKRPTPLKRALEDAAEDARLGAGGVSLAAEVDARAQVLADPEQLHRILANLLRNAREAIDGVEARGGVGRVTVSLEQEGGESRIRVVDDGPGLPERAQTNLFQPFAGSARRGGTGLGLAIARELAQAHGGDLVLVATGPEGTSFELRLPGAPEPAAPRRRQKAAEE